MYILYMEIYEHAYIHYTAIFTYEHRFQYYCNRSLYINYIYSFFFVMEHIIEKSSWPRDYSNLCCRSQSTDMLCSRPSNITKKDASSPELSNTVFSGVASHDVRINIRTIEWEKTVLFSPGLDASSFVDV